MKTARAYTSHCHLKNLSYLSFNATVTTYKVMISADNHIEIKEHTYKSHCRRLDSLPGKLPCFGRCLWALQLLLRDTAKPSTYASGVLWTWGSGRVTWRGHSPPFQWASITGNASRDVGSSFWRGHFPISLPSIQPWCHGTLQLGWDLGWMGTLAGIPLPFVVIPEGKFELIGNTFVHLVLHHWHAVGFWATPVKREDQEKTSEYCLIMLVETDYH